MEAWVVENWFSLVQSVGVIGALSFNGYSLHRQSNAMKGEFLALHTQNHRHIWELAIQDSVLARVLEPKVDLVSDPPTVKEAIFINLIILHLDATLTAVHRGVMDKPPGLKLDVAEFFSLPIPNHIWKTTKRFRSPRLVKIVEGKRKRGKRRLARFTSRTKGPGIRDPK